MTQRTKLIVGAVVLLGAYYLYDRNKKMNTVSDLKEGADLPPPPPLVTMPTIQAKETLQVNPSTLTLADDVGKKFSNFDGKRGNSYFETIF